MLNGLSACGRQADNVFIDYLSLSLLQRECTAVCDGNNSTHSGRGHRRSGYVAWMKYSAADSHSDKGADAASSLEQATPALESNGR